MNENGNDEEIYEVEDHLQPERSGPIPPEPPSEGIPWGAIFLGVWAVLLIIFAVQNAETAPVNFLGWSIEMPVAMVVMVTALITLILTGLGSFFYRRRRQKRALEKRAGQSDQQSPPAPPSPPPS